MMGILKIEGVTHWSIPVNDLEESEAFYGDLLGLDFIGRLGGTLMSCYGVGEHRILLCVREKPGEPEDRIHHSLTVTPETLELACKVFKEREVPIVDLIYRATGTFIGRELYFLDPSGNKLELRDPTWLKGMPEPTYDEITAS